VRLVALSVLYIHPIGAFGGASRSLLELLRAFPPGAVQPKLIMPRGQVASIFEATGNPLITARGISQLDFTRFGFYRGLRWLILLREIYFLPGTVWALWRARRLWRHIDLIHVNEGSVLLPALLAKALFRKPLLIHVRSVQQTEGIALRARFRDWVLARRAEAVVAIDETVRASLPRGLAVEVVHNSFTPDQEGESDARIDRLAGRLNSGSLRVGMIGNLLAAKGIYEFLEAARLCIQVYEANVDFLIVGSNPRRLSGLHGRVLKMLGWAHDVESDVEQFVAQHGLAARIHRLEFTPHISAVYRLLDVVCFPSYLDAVGRPVLEAAWFGIPCIAAVERPAPDTFRHGETGLRVPPKDPEALARTIVDLTKDRALLRRMGEAARGLAVTNFDSSRNALRMLRIYERLTAGSDASSCA
jgi:glycosyltransferase involved in cell wall biosynthesis